ncbi:unnamed protein product [Oncorhynchus mykiss]|uniref:PHD-type domain-containing protein n=1 Tax=Oncorhynchus mykiss TaxID=8022 RepID=A0A060YG58_ONCMY|nr:unnamed protein product [Oncorhynchus mykiss]
MDHVGRNPRTGHCLDRERSSLSLPLPLYFYLPLLRQCSECDQASSDDADIAMETLPDGTKRSRRQIKGPIKFIPQEMSPEPKKRDVRGTRTRGQKRKRVSICEEEQFEVQEPALRERRQRQSVMQKKTPKADDTRTDCTSCKGPGDNENLVRWVTVCVKGGDVCGGEERGRKEVCVHACIQMCVCVCDECCLCYHFGCLDPPLKKSPKQTGYGWICQECDTSSSKVCVVLCCLCVAHTLGGDDDDVFFWHHIIEAAVKQLNINLQQILPGNI